MEERPKDIEEKQKMTKQTLKGVVSRTHWITLLQKVPAELASKAKEKEGEEEGKSGTKQDWVSLQYVLEAAVLSGGARALSSRLNSLAIELEGSVVDPVLKARLGEDVRPFVKELVDVPNRLESTRLETTSLGESIEKCLTTARVDFKNQLAEVVYHDRVESLLNSVLSILTVPQQAVALCCNLKDSYSNVLEAARLIESATATLAHAGLMTSDGLDRVRNQLVAAADEVITRTINHLKEELFLEQTDLFSEGQNHSPSDDLFMKEKLSNLITAAVCLKRVSRCGEFFEENYFTLLLALIERCIAAARESYLKRSPGAKLQAESRGYDLLNVKQCLAECPIIGNLLSDDECLKLQAFLQLFTFALTGVMRRCIYVNSTLTDLGEFDNFLSLDNLWFAIQQITVVEFGHILETEYPNVNSYENDMKFSPDEVKVTSRRRKSADLNLRERFEEKVETFREKARNKGTQYRESRSKKFDSSTLPRSNSEENFNSMDQTNRILVEPFAHLSSLASQTSYWLGLQPSVLWTPVLYGDLVAFSRRVQCLVSTDINQSSQLRSSQKEPIEKGQAILFVFLEGFVRNHFCKAMMEKVDIEGRRLCSESDAFTMVLLDQIHSSKELMDTIEHSFGLPGEKNFSFSRIVRNKYARGRFYILKCCREAFAVVEEAAFVEKCMNQGNFERTEMFQLILSPLLKRFADTLARILRALLAPFWGDKIVDSLMEAETDHWTESLEELLASLESDLNADTLKMTAIVYNSAASLLEVTSGKCIESLLESAASSAYKKQTREYLERLVYICSSVFKLEGLKYALAHCSLNNDFWVAGTDGRLDSVMKEKSYFF